MSFDRVTERLGRRLAARTSRRTFLSRVGQVGVLVASGPALATLLAQRAEARVCGQSGVSPLCPTFDCEGADDVWGWCWYASPGCCSDGGLKKICDCCTYLWPNVHGYCPSGYNVRCAVESCAADPRVQYRPIERVGGLSPAGMTMTRSRQMPSGRGGTVVVGDADDPLAASVAGPVAGAVGGHVLLTGRTRLSANVIEELQRLAPSAVVVVGPALSSSIDTELAGYGYAVTRPHGAGSLAQASGEVATWIRARTGTRRAMVVADWGASAAAAPAAAALAVAKGMPLVVGVETAAALANAADPIAVSYLVGNEAAGRAGEVAGGFPIWGGDVASIAAAVADLALGTEGIGACDLHLVPAAEAGLAAGFTGLRGVFLFHPDGGLGGGWFDWVWQRRQSFLRAVTVSIIGGLSDDGRYELQSALNNYGTQYLQGVAGQGLPVISQPESERELGQARVAGAATEPYATYWSGRATPKS